MQDSFVSTLYLIVRVVATWQNKVQQPTYNTQTFPVAQVYRGKFKQKFDLPCLYLKYGKLTTLNKDLKCKTQ